MRLLPQGTVWQGAQQGTLINLDQPQQEVIPSLRLELQVEEPLLEVGADRSRSHNPEV